MHPHRSRRNAHSWLWHTTHAWALSCGSNPGASLAWDVHQPNLGINLVVHPYQHPIYMVEINGHVMCAPCTSGSFFLRNVGFACLGLGKSYLNRASHDHPSVVDYEFSVILQGLFEMVIFQFANS